MKRTDSGLFIASNFNFLRMRKRERTVTLPSGERAKITVDDSGTVKQIEHGDILDAIVRPAPVRIDLRPRIVRTGHGGFARPNPIRSAFRPRKATNEQG